MKLIPHWCAQTYNSLLTGFLVNRTILGEVVNFLAEKDKLNLILFLPGLAGYLEAYL